MTRFRLPSRHFLAAGLLASLLAAGGCKDVRAPSGGPSSGSLSGRALFEVAQVSAAIFAHQNAMAERVLRIVQGSEQTPIFIPSCDGGPGEVRIAKDPRIPDRFKLTHELFVPYCLADPHLALTLSGEMFITILETSPGLHYRIEMPFQYYDPQDPQDSQGWNVPQGMVYQLPLDLSGTILETTTPGVPQIESPYGENSFLDCVFVPGSLPGTGTVHQTGAIRLEERDRLQLVVEELDIEYGVVRTDSTTTFSPWPSGQYEVGVFGTDRFGTPTTATPVDVFFDGLGGVTFEVGGGACTASLVTGNNPCEEF